MSNYYCIIAVRNGEKTIAPTIQSLIEQSVRPKKIIIVDDGSEDGTSKILKNYSNSFPDLFEIINTSSKKRDYARIPVLWNLCLRKEYEYCLISGGDCIFEKKYAEKILAEMNSDNNLVACSGNFGNHKSERPRGAGRFVRQSFFFKYYQKYPEIVGYESEILEKAQSLGYNIKIINDARFTHADKLGHGHSFVEFGMAMKSLGYYPPYVLGRFVKDLITGAETGRKGAIQMLWNYLKFRPQKTGYYSLFPKNLRELVRDRQKQLIKSKLKNLFSNNN